MSKDSNLSEEMRLILDIQKDLKVIKKDIYELTSIPKGINRVERDVDNISTKLDRTIESVDTKIEKLKFDLETSTEKRFVSNHEFQPIKLVVFGLVGMILVTVFKVLSTFIFPDIK